MKILSWGISGFDERGAGRPNGAVLNGVTFVYRIPLKEINPSSAHVKKRIISHRVYKKPFTHTKAVSIIRKGTHFDPDIAEGYLAVQEAFRQIALQLADYEEKKSLGRPLSTMRMTSLSTYVIDD